MTLSRILTLSLVLGLAACKGPTPTAPAAPKATSTAKPATPVAPDDNLNAVLWVQTSAEFQALSTQTYHAAALQLGQALREKNWTALVADEVRATKADLPPAVILDVDETVLDNSPYQARLVAQGAEYDEVSWDAWVSEKKAKALPGVVDFARAAQSRGITVLYLSNRATHLKAATLENLRAVGMPVKDDSVFLGLGTFVEGCEQNGSEKSCRRQLAGRKYRVLMQFGDQLGDFVQVLANTPAGRATLLAGYHNWFGERWWMLPNPTYGSWEPALFNNDFHQPRDARRDAKRHALVLSQ